jgi:hypothetical protein
MGRKRKLRATSWLARPACPADQAPGRCLPDRSAAGLAMAKSAGNANPRWVAIVARVCHWPGFNRAGLPEVRPQECPPARVN